MDITHGFSFFFFSSELSDGIPLYDLLISSIEGCVGRPAILKAS